MKKLKKKIDKCQEFGQTNPQEFWVFLNDQALKHCNQVVKQLFHWRF